MNTNNKIYVIKTEGFGSNGPIIAALYAAYTEFESAVMALLDIVSNNSNGVLEITRYNSDYKNFTVVFKEYNTDFSVNESKGVIYTIESVCIK